MTPDEKNAWLNEHTMPLVREIEALDAEIATLEAARVAGDAKSRRAVQTARRRYAETSDRLIAVLSSSDN